MFIFWKQSNVRQDIIRLYKERLPKDVQAMQNAALKATNIIVGKVVRTIYVQRAVELGSHSITISILTPV